MRQDYFFVPSPTGEFTTEDTPLHINCAGLTDTSDPFITCLAAGRLDYTVYYVTEGEILFSFDGKPEEAVRAGALVIIPPRMPLVYRHREERPIRIFWLHLTGSYVPGLLAECGLPEDGGIFPIPVTESGIASCRTLLDRMKDPPDSFSRLRAAAAAVHMLTVLGQLTAEKAGERRLEKSLSYLREHFTEQIEKEDLAAMEGLGLSRYNTLFRRLTGYSPARYITKLRLSLAEALLGDPLKSISEIAVRCGYDDPFYFCRVFRREYGISPSEYRGSSLPGSLPANEH